MKHTFKIVLPSQEITWNIMTGVDLESGKKPLRERSPFIDVPMINCADKVESNYYDRKIIMITKLS